MKKKIALLLCAAAIFTLFAACGKADPPKPPAQTPDTKPPENQKPRPQRPTDIKDDLMDAAGDLWDGMKSLFEEGENAVRFTEDKGDIFDKEYGINKDIFESYTLRTSDDENRPAEFFIARVKDGKMAEAEAALEKRRTAITEKWGEKNEYAKKPLILKSGNYIMLALHADAEKAAAQFEKLTAGK